MKLNDKQLNRLKEYQLEVKISQEKMNAFIDGASLGFKFDRNKKYTFDLDTGVFKEKEEQINV